MKKEIIDHQQAVAKKVFSVIKNKLDQYAIIAGGAPRDWYFGNPCKDVDIFINPTKNSGQWLVNFLVNEGCDVTKKVASEDLLEHYRSEHIRNVIWFSYLGVEFNLIVVTGSTFNIVDTFPISVSKIWISDKRFRYGKSTDFVLSEKYNVMFKTTEDDNRESYIRKMCDKFPEMSYFANKVSALESIITKELQYE